MNFALDETQRRDCSIEDLARIILRLMKEGISGRVQSHYGLEYMHETLCPENERKHVLRDPSFCKKFYEAIALLKQRGLLMDAASRCFGNMYDAVCFTSAGKESYLNEGILILVDDARKVVQSLKEEIHNLDRIVEQYYLESLRTCQSESYISSVICLGAASERSIKCLAEAIVQSNPQCKNDIDRIHTISALTRHLLDNAKQLFKPLEPSLANRLTENLKGLAHIYRINRNEAGHPTEVPQDWKRNDQECWLSQFRRFAITCFSVIEVLDRSKRATQVRF